MRKTIKVNNITCVQCAKTIESHFSKLNIEAKVLVTSKKVIFNYNEKDLTLDDITDNLLKIGYYPTIDNEQQIKAKRKDFIDLMIAIVFSLPLLYTMFNHLGMSFIPVPDLFMNAFFQWALASIVLFIPGRRFFIQTFNQIKYKNLGMDALVVIGTVSAYIYSIVETFRTMNMHHNTLYFETTAVIILMVLIGNFFENRVKEKTSDALQQLVSLGAKEAKVKVNGTFISKKIDDVKVDDVVLVLANEKIPVDGIVVKGKTYVDEAMITGESMPASKEVGSKVIGSTMNIYETIEVKVTEDASNSVLAKIIETVENTALIKPKAQRIADKIASIFVPAVVGISLIVFVIYLLTNHSLTESFSPAIAVLVISCPCALGLATPTSISVASGMAFKQGIMYKGGEFFEIANKINAIAFDKTGTLTKGKPELIDFIGDKETLQLTASIEAHSNHPIADAIKFAYDGTLLEVTDFEVLVGLGLKGKINQDAIYVGSKKLANELKVEIPYDGEKYLNEGKTVFYTIKNNEVINMITIADEIKDGVKELIQTLKSRGIKPFMITGDEEKTARYIAQLVGIDDVYASVLPQEKAQIVETIQNEGYVCAFVGDGINDAPALKMADVGIAVSNGSDIAINSSDVTLMHQDLSLVLDAIDLSLATLKNIYVNFFWAFIYNICMIPLAALGFLNPSLAGIGMGFSSIMVVLNALSLKLFKFKTTKES
ncbi:heavy metal translocating P-type ATPase [Acholeplasma hippikon]|uniref:Copper-exporting P-type ATPase A n=1 Tax=Acholeplasma hippikon TaxID=264636 RepID=A0A449BKE5_9MOLU|nr:heavy metal translocating P-type ATPase [Acholeplasma hippikon]VEU82936.1 Copper-exporting P-type ATPase A [Acholeplasma hippikon]